MILLDWFDDGYGYKLFNLVKEELYNDDYHLAQGKLPQGCFLILKFINSINKFYIDEISIQCHLHKTPAMGYKFLFQKDEDYVLWKLAVDD